MKIMFVGVRNGGPSITSNECLRVGGPDGVQEEHRRFILVRVEKCPTSSEGGEFCIILHRSARSRGYKRI
jgi:hypothetical protein